MDLSLDLALFASGDNALNLALAARYLAPLLAVLILARCLRSMLRERYDPETWAYLYLPGEIMLPLKHWECLLGRSRTVDASIDDPSLQRTHACLLRSPKGQWKVYSLGRAKTFVNGKKVGPLGAVIADADVLTLGQVPCRFVDLTEEERARVLQYRHAPGRRVRPAGTFFYLTVFQLLLALEHTALNPAGESGSIALAFASLCALQWAYFFVLRGTGRTGFEADTLAFFLSSLGLSVAASSNPEGIAKQLILTLAGVLLFIFLSLWTRSLTRMKKLVLPMAVAAVVFLGLNLVIAEVTYGAQNWIMIGGFSLQPSEFVKICYIYAGAATLDRLFVNRNLIFFIGFSAACVGCLALMGDFGTALIFFITFLVIAFMRSGSFATTFLAVGGAVIACMLVLTVKPYIAERFATWGHVWENVYDGGWQQAQAMGAAASGGLFGKGAGRGWLIDVFAADTDMVWAVLCEELGLIVALCAVGAVLAIALFAARSSATGRSSYYVIAACGTATIFMSQMSLNVFGTVDVLPFTGVTFPFVSIGGSSLLSCWMLLAFIKAADTRANASFAVTLPERLSRKFRLEEEYEDYDDYDDYDEYDEYDEYEEYEEYDDYGEDYDDRQPERGGNRR